MGKTTFRPENFDGPSYPDVFSISNTSYTVQSSDAGNLLKFTSDDNVSVTIAQNSEAVIPIGSTITIMQLGNGAITVSPSSGVQILGISSLVSRGPYHTITLAKSDTDQWITPTDNGPLKVSVQETEPDNPQVGDLWFW